MEICIIKGFEEIRTSDSKMLRILKEAQKVAKSGSTVLITGESGTGKELIAKGIHKASARSGGPFVAVNCGAIPQELLESELMGFERGAFTGAVSRKVGDFESANGGTIFLDEVSSLPLSLQAKLLRVLQEREIKRLGANKTTRLDMRVISATNVDLEREVGKGLFRQDLYFRLNVVPIHIPPLRDRKGDIPLLLEHFIEKICSRLKKEISGYSRELISVLQRYQWPGNVREFENLVERIVLFKEDRMPVMVKDLPVDIVMSERKGYYQRADDAMGLRERCMVYEKREIIKTLHDVKWSRGKAARQLKIHRNTLIQKMKKLNIPLESRKKEDRD